MIRGTMANVSRRTEIELKEFSNPVINIEHTSTRQGKRNVSDMQQMKDIHEENFVEQQNEETERKSGNKNNRPHDRNIM